MTAELFAGIDVGTSGCKMLVYDKSGKVICRAARQYQEHGSGGHREIEPDEVRENVLDMLCQVGKECGASVRALSVASLGESIVCLDEQGQVLARSMVTGDIRGLAEVDRLVSKLGRDKIFRITGLPPNELYGLPKYIWLNENTDAIKKARMIMFFEDYIGYLLTGERRVSYTSAARSLAFDIRKKTWCGELLGLAGIREEQMSAPVAPLTAIGRIRPELAELTGLSPELELYAGGHDQTCAAIGSGLRDGDTAECGMGTCEFMFMMLDRPQMTGYMSKNDLTCIPYVLEDTYLTSLEITTCGILKNWARDTIFAGLDTECIRNNRSFYEHIEGLAARCGTEVMVLPQFGSSGNPDINMDTVGTITGLTVHTRPEEIYRAILESFALQMRYACQRAGRLGLNVRKIAATGGGARSGLTLQIRADVFNMEVLALESDEAGTLGCAMMAAAGAGAFPSICAAIDSMVRVSKIYKPDSAMVEYYNEKYRKFEILYKKMHSAF